MQQHYPQGYPDILDSHDLNIMGEAYLLALTEVETVPVDQKRLGRLILRFYRSGLVDPNKLATVAATAADRRDTPA